MKNHKCDLCDKAFNRPEHLKSHIKGVHEKLKNSKCDFCDNNFTQIVNLKRHIENVHEAKLFTETRISIYISIISI